MCSVSGFLGTVVRVGYTHSREPTHRVSSSSGLVRSVRFVDGQSHLCQRRSPLAAVAASALVKVGACCPYRSVALRAPFLVFPLSFPFPVRLDWYALDLTTVKITLVTLFFPRRWAFRKVNEGNHRSCQAPRQLRRGQRQLLGAEVYDNAFDMYEKQPRL